VKSLYPFTSNGDFANPIASRILISTREPGTCAGNATRIRLQFREKPSTRARSGVNIRVGRESDVLDASRSEAMLQLVEQGLLAVTGELVHPGGIADEYCHHAAPDFTWSRAARDSFSDE
jgi:hypothetical protein